jgi:threonine aldolase
MIPIKIDLFSDTMTRPTPQMRRFMCAAEVGDEQKFEDPTVNLLQEMVSDLLGKETALFLPSGTMANQISIKLHCQPGQEMLCDKTAHPLNFEGGGPAALSGVMVQPLAGVDGIFNAHQVEEAVRPINRYAPRTRLVSVEQTSNMGGGTIWPLETITQVCAAARRHALATHMDGARLMNAVVASGVPARDFAAGFDSVWLDLSKGLGAPVGAVLAGTREFIQEAWQWKQRLGGAMRQAGIIAAAGVYALRNHIERLAQDHENARRLATNLAGVPRLKVQPEKVQTNIVMLDVSATGKSSLEIISLLLEKGIRLSPAGPSCLRAVTHLDISTGMIDEAVESIRQVLSSLP